MKPYYSLSDFPDRKNAGKNFIARCPKCGTMHLYISKAKGLYHCFYAGCDFNGILTDYCKDNRPMFPYKKGDSPSNTGTYRPQDSRNAENSVNEVPMLPGDYKALALEHGVRNSAQIRDWVKRYREGGEDALAVHPPGRRRKEPASEETLEQRCARLEMEVEILKRMAASATDLSATGGSTR